MARYPRPLTPLAGVLLVIGMLGGCTVANVPLAEQPANPPVGTAPGASGSGLLVTGDDGDGGQLPTGDPAAAAAAEPPAVAPNLPKDHLRIGIKFDQPGIGYMKNGVPTGFDVDTAAYVAMKLGYDPMEIEWVETTSAHREEYLANGTVDMVFASYSMSDERRDVIDFAGPYLISGQDFLVRIDDTEFTGPDSVAGKVLCAAAGSNSTKRIQELFGDVAEIMVTPDYSTCVQAVVDGKADAASTDDHILAGFASGPEFYGLVRLVGAPFNIEKVGVGLPNDSPELCAQVNAALADMIADGTWNSIVARHSFGVDYDPFAYDNPPQFEQCE